MKPRGYGKGSDWNGNRYGGFGRGKGMTRPSWLNDGKGKGKGKGVGAPRSDFETSFSGMGSGACGSLHVQPQQPTVSA